MQRWEANCERRPPLATRSKRMDLSQSIRSGTKWLVAGNAGGQFLQFSFGVVLARLLVPADFGLLVTVQVFTGFVGLVASGGTGEALIRAKDVSDRDFHVVFTMQLTAGVLIYLSFFTIAPWFAQWFHDPLYKVLLRVSAISFLARPFSNIHAVWLRREMRFKEISLISLIAMLFSNATSVGMALSGMGVWSLILGGLCGALLNIGLISRRTPLRLRLAFDPRTAKGHSTYGFKFTANEVVTYLRDQTSNLIISRISGPASVGIYNKAQSLGQTPLSMFSGPVYQTVFRAMSAVQDDRDKTKYMFLKMISLLGLYTLPFYVGIWWLAAPLIGFFYGQKWAASTAPLEIIALAGLIFCVGHPCGAVLAAQNRLGRELIAQTIGLFVVATGSYVGLRWGLSGVAVAFLVGHLYTTTHMYWLVRQCLPVSSAEVFKSLQPGLILNTSLILILAAFSLLLSAELPLTHPAIYMFACATVGGITYLIAFLFLPLPMIESEVLRFKKMLRLAS